jgi:hypothetical protein
MFIIDDRGKLIEGQPLTEEEASIYKELNEPGAGIYAASCDYIKHDNIAKIAQYLIGKFEMKRRAPQQVEVPEPDVLDAPEPVALEVEAPPSA